MKNYEFKVYDEEMKYMMSWEEVQEQWESEGYSDNIFNQDHYKVLDYINYNDINNEKLYTNDIIFYHRHEGWYVESTVVNKLGVIVWDKDALGYRIKPIDTHSYKVNYGVDGEKIRTSHRVIKVGNIFDSNIEELVKQYLKKSK